MQCQKETKWKKRTKHQIPAYVKLIAQLRYFKLHVSRQSTSYSETELQQTSYKHFCCTTATIIHVYICQLGTSKWKKPTKVSFIFLYVLYERKFHRLQVFITTVCRKTCTNMATLQANHSVLFLFMSSKFLYELNQFYFEASYFNTEKSTLVYQVPDFYFK